jgi:putative DNA primase/helicase
VSPATPLHLAVAAALDAGLAVIPPMQDGTKRPIGPWKDYQTVAPSRQQVRAWYGGKDAYLGLGILTGTVSGVEMLELEGRAIADGLLIDLMTRAEAVGLGELVARIEGGYTETTPSGGLHWIYGVDPVLGNTKLAETASHETLIETRGEGGYCITAPSNGSVHPHGGRWAMTEGGFASIATITPAERDALFDLCRTFDRLPAPTPRPGVPSGSDRPGDRYNAAPGVQDRVLELLERHGWTRVYSSAGVDYLRRPGKDGPGVSASLGHVAPGVLRVFSSSTAFEVGAHAPFGVYALLEHEGDFSAAARALEPGVTINGIPHEPASENRQTVTLASTDWPRLPKEAAYHGLLGDIVRAVAGDTEADPVGVLGSLLTIFGSLSRGHVRTG